MSNQDGMEPMVAAQWISTVLNADSTLTAAAPGGIWDGPAEHNTEYPLVQFGAQSPGVPVRGVGTVDVWLDMLWLVRGICPGQDITPLVPVARQIHANLHGVTQQTVPGGIIVSCVREQAFRLENPIRGREYRQLGGIFRLQVQST